MIISDENVSDEFRTLVAPIMEFLSRGDIFHPHVTIIITSTHAEIVEGVLSTVKEGYYAEADRTLHPAKDKVRG